MSPETDLLGETVDRCARVCEDMVVGGRAWTIEQKAAAHALFSAAREIRKLKKGCRCGQAHSERCPWRPLPPAPPEQLELI